MSENKLSKVSFIGDLMCERPFLKAAMRRKDLYFDGFLKPCESLFSKSEIVVANLETPCDPESPLTKNTYIFNAPVSFVKEIKKSGISFVTTASNHCLDRGLKGLKNTINVLDQIGLSHTGTFNEKRDSNFDVISLKDGTKIALISYTYGTNYLDNKQTITSDDNYSINYLTPLLEGRNNTNEKTPQSLRAKILRIIPHELRLFINGLIGRSPSSVSYVDTIVKGDINDTVIESIKKTVEHAKELCDFVVVCPHFGGQFNVKPGSYVEYFVELFDSLKADLVVGNHPHLTQEFILTNSNMKVAYSLGNVSMSLCTPYIILDNYPECSVMLHAYFGNGMIKKMSFSILIEIETDGFITVYPLHDLYEISDGDSKELLYEKNRIIYNRFLNKSEKTVPILEEYEILLESE